MTAQELAQVCKTTEREIRKNFPEVGVRALKQGILITRIKHEKEWDYNYEMTTPRVETKDYFALHSYNRGSADPTNLPNEIWVEAYCSKEHEVSNLGRIRHKKTKIIHKGRTTDKGYQWVSINSHGYLVHRVVLQSFHPQEDPNLSTVDHINGKKLDNRLENLQWLSNEENVIKMMTDRSEITKETTKLIQKCGYEKTLELLQELNKSLAG